LIETGIKMNAPSGLRYSPLHTWLRQESDGSVTVGITDHAQETLGDLVFVEAPAVGRQVKKDEACGIVESVKTASDVHAPASGEVIAVNPELDDTPEKINADAYAAWIFKLKPSNTAEFASLLDEAAYQKMADAD
jgi:glycine cleavage system H protein